MKQNRITTVEDMNVSPTCGKPTVSCCPGLYQEAIDYAEWLIRINKSQIDAYDLVHDLIAYNNFKYEDYKQKIKSHFLITVRLKSETEKSVLPKQKGVNFHQCKHCQDQLPDCAYRIVYLSNGLQKLRTSCKKCEAFFNKKRMQVKRAKLKNSDLSFDQLYYKKRKLCPIFMEKRRKQMRDYMREYRSAKDSSQRRACCEVGAIELQRLGSELHKC